MLTLRIRIEQDHSDLIVQRPLNERERRPNHQIIKFTNTRCKLACIHNAGPWNHHQHCLLEVISRRDINDCGRHFGGKVLFDFNAAEIVIFRVRQHKRDKLLHQMGFGLVVWSRTLPILKSDDFPSPIHPPPSFLERVLTAIGIEFLDSMQLDTLYGVSLYFEISISLQIIGSAAGNIH